MKKAAAGASPKVAKCLVASVATRTNGVNACTDGVHLRDAEWVWAGGLALDTLLVSDAIQNEHLDASAASVWLKTQDSADDPAHSRVL